MVESNTLSVKSIGGDSTSGVRVLFIHGFGADQQSWTGNAPAVFDFAESFVVDLPGHGQSVGVKGCDGLSSVAALLMKDAVFSQPVHLVGHSVGAAVAVLCAADQPQRVKSVTLLAPLGLGQGVDTSFTKSMTGLTTGADALELLQSLVHNKRLIAGALGDFLIAQLNKAGAREALIAFADTLHQSGSSVDAAFAKIVERDINRQVFWGKQDSVNQLNTADILSFGGDWHCLEECGHLPHIEHRNFVNTKLCEFLKSNEGL